MSDEHNPREDVLAAFDPAAWSPWPLTPRTRFELALALALLGEGIDYDLTVSSRGSDEPGTAATAETLAEFPVLTRTQTKAWWRLVEAAAQRMSTAIATGEHWNPRTPAEEAVVYVAIENWVHHAHESLVEDVNFAPAYRQLPADPDEDFAWDSVLQALTGDVDVEQLWDPSRDGAEHPDTPSNAYLGIGDYRPAAWHNFFDRHLREPEDPSGLY